MKRSQLMAIAARIASRDYAGAVSLIDAALINETGAHWVRDLTKLAATLCDGIPRFTVLHSKGNSKLPFLSFSALPVVACPGAGECASFCYSLKSWRYPAAFCGMAQNTMLLHTATGRDVIRGAMDYELTRRQNAGRTVDFRLYVDGDFDSVATVAFWFDLLRTTPQLKCYGYSKSYTELLAYAKTGSTLPANYVLNISSGHNHSADTVAKVKALSITRGDFIALVPVAKQSTGRDLAAQHRAATGRKAFPCPGECGSCRTVGGQNAHACGDARLAGVDVIIAMH